LTRLSFAITRGPGALTLTLPKPTPPFLTVRRRRRHLELAVVTSPVCVKTREVDLLGRARQDVRAEVRLVVSTPIPQTPFSFAAWSAPRPQPPAAAKTTFEPCAIWFSASSLHFAWSTKSCE
jgi:hypothetical protein